MHLEGSGYSSNTLPAPACSSPWAYKVLIVPLLLLRKMRPLPKILYILVVDTGASGGAGVESREHSPRSCSGEYCAVPLHGGWHVSNANRTFSCTWHLLRPHSDSGRGNSSIASWTLLSSLMGSNSNSNTIHVTLAKFLTSPCLSFLICSKGIKRRPTLKAIVKI